MNYTKPVPLIALLLAVILSATCFSQAKAVIVSTTTGNTTAPEDDFGFANVGVKGSSTGVYLGYRWVLTAAHTSAADITLNGQVYQYETGTDTRLTNPTGLGLSEYTDLRLFRITEDPWLPTLKIAETQPEVWDEIVMIGNGNNRADTLKAWNIDTEYSEQETWVWTETDLPGDIQGYLYGSGKTLRWGTNRVEPGMYTISLGSTNQFLGFFTDFDHYDGTEFEAQAATGDSGGGVFHKNGDQWELAGIIHAVSTFPNQPSQAIYGLETYCSDLSVYRDIILDIITPLSGDANLDGTVNAVDASIMAANWGRTDHVLWGHGDFNEDGVVDSEDAALLAQNWGTSSSGSTPAETALPNAIPEPSGCILLLAGLATVLLRLRRQDTP